MTKDQFLKQVTLLFSTSGFAELNRFLEVNHNEALAHKKLIMSLNKELGDPSVSATLTKLQAGKKDADKQLKKTIELAIKNEDEKLLFDTLNTLEINQQYEKFRYDISSNKKLFNKFLKSMIDNIEQLYQTNKNHLKYDCISLRTEDILNDAGKYYCQKIGTTKDKVVWFKSLAEIMSYSPEKPEAETSEFMNKFYDFLNEHEKDSTYDNPFNYFVNRPAQLVFLNKDKIDKVIAHNKIEPSDIVTELLGTRSYDHAKIYLKKETSQNIKISLPHYISALKYAFDTSRFTIDETNVPGFDKIIDLFRLNESFIMGLFNDDKIKSVFKKNHFELTDAQFKEFIGYLKKDDIEPFFYETKIFKINNNQKLLIKDLLENFETHAIKAINALKGNYPADRLLGYGALKDFVNKNIDNKEFIAKISPDGKQAILTNYLDYSNIKDSENFINNFLADTPVQHFSCLHMRFLGELLPNNSAVFSYIINEKTDMSNISLYAAVDVFHLLNEDKKKEVVKSFLSEKYKNLTNENYNTSKLSEQEKQNFKDIQALHKELVSTNNSKKMKA